MRRSNIIIAAVAAVAVAVCLLASFAMQPDEGGRQFYDGEYRTFDGVGDITCQEAEEMWDDAVSDYLEVTLAEGLTAEAASEAFGSIYDTMNLFRLNIMKWTWEYYRDSVSYSEAYREWTGASVYVFAEYSQALRESLLGPGGDAVRAVIGDEAADRMLSEDDVSEEELRLREREIELSNMYGRCETVQEYADLYAELIDVRNRLAELNGYGTYADYAYANKYNRGYTPSEAESVKDVLVELYSPVYAEVKSLYGDGSQIDAEPLDVVRDFAPDICPEMGELYTFMESNGLIDVEDTENRFDIACCNYVIAQEWRTITLFSFPGSDTDSLLTLVHEFGHASAFSLAPEPSMDFDLNEVQSQGLESLFALVSEDYVGREAAEGVRMMLMYRLLDCLVDGYFWDEFQRIAYETDAGSAEEFDAIQAALEEEYGYGAMHWSQLDSNYANPFYFISYSVSAAGALGIWAEAMGDREAALDTYLDVLLYSGTYTGAVEDLGILDPFDSGEMEEMYRTLALYLESEMGIEVA